MYGSCHGYRGHDRGESRSEATFSGLHFRTWEFSQPKTMGKVVPVNCVNSIQMYFHISLLYYFDAVHLAGTNFNVFWYDSVKKNKGI